MKYAKGLYKFKVALVLKVLGSRGEIISSAEFTTLGQLFLNSRNQMHSDFYDLLAYMDPLSSSPEGIRRYTEMCISFCDKHNEVAFLSLMRYIILHHNTAGSSVLSTSLMLGAMLSDFYGPGMVTGVNEDKIFRDGLCEGECGSIFDLALAMICMNPNVRIEVVNKDNGTTQDALLMSSSSMSRCKTILDKLDGVNIVAARLVEQGVTCKGILYHIGQKLGSIYGRAAFSRLAGGVSRYIYTINMESENIRIIKGERSNWALMSRYVGENIPQTLLHNRGFYVREKGIVVKLSDSFDSISKLYMTEIHRKEEDEHYIFVRVWDDSEDFMRDMVLPLDDLYAGIVPLLLEIDYTTYWFILYLLGLWDLLMMEILKLDFYQEQSLREYVTKQFKDLKNKFDSMTIRYEEPVWWNYELKPTQYNGDSKVPLVTKSINIGRYTRALPEGQTASSEAQNLAKLYHIELKPGYTMVDDFTRSINVRAKLDKTQKFS